MRGFSFADLLNLLLRYAPTMDMIRPCSIQQGKMMEKIVDKLPNLARTLIKQHGKQMGKKTVDYLIRVQKYAVYLTEDMGKLIHGCIDKEIELTEMPFERFVIEVVNKSIPREVMIEVEMGKNESNEDCLNIGLIMFSSGSFVGNCNFALLKAANGETAVWVAEEELEDTQKKMMWFFGQGIEYVSSFVKCLLNLVTSKMARPRI